MTRTPLTPSIAAISACICWVTLSVSASADPGGSSTDTEMRDASSAGRKLPGIWTMKYSDTARTPRAATSVR